MKLQLLAEVTKLETNLEYPKKPGTADRDYSKPQVEVITSTLRILANPEEVTGTITLPNVKLEHGAIYRFIVTDNPIAKVVQGVDAAVAEATEAVDRVMGGQQ